MLPRRLPQRHSRSAITHDSLSFNIQRRTANPAAFQFRPMHPRCNQIGDHR